MSTQTTPPTLVLQPAFSFAELGAALAARGWARGRDTMVAPPLVEGEPEFATWSQGGGEDGEGGRLSYTFNPVVGLRVLVCYGARAAETRDELARALPALGEADLRSLLSDDEDDPRTLLLGLLAARALRAVAVVDLLEALCAHGHPTVAKAAQEAYAEILQTLLEVGAERLREEKRRRPERSALFPHVGDAHVRRQTLRWLMRDYRAANEHILAVLRAALEDEDWEVRATAVIAAARLGASALMPDVRRAELPRTPGEGIGETDIPILHAARGAVLDILAGQPPPGEGAGPQSHIRRCVLGEPVGRRDRVYDFINSLAEPDEGD